MWSHRALAASPGGVLGVGQSNPRFSRGDEGERMDKETSMDSLGTTVKWAWLVYQTESNCFQHNLWEKVVA